MTFKLLRFSHLPIQKQLHLEENLLRHEKGNYIVLNTETPPAIVLGISNKEHDLVHLDALPSHIPLVRRFSGGGTVIVDEETVFVTFICNKTDFAFAPYPEPILRFAAAQLKLSLPDLELKENDFVVGDKKCGGNALYIKKDRWLIHTSFLWSYAPDRMALLKHPAKAPSYRGDRSHVDFLCPVSSLLPCKRGWMDLMAETLIDRSSFNI